MNHRHRRTRYAQTTHIANMSLTFDTSQPLRSVVKDLAPWNLYLVLIGVNIC